MPPKPFRIPKFRPNKPPGYNEFLRSIYPTNLGNPELLSKRSLNQAYAKCMEELNPGGSDIAEKHMQSPTSIATMDRFLAQVRERADGLARTQERSRKVGPREGSPVPIQVVTKYAGQINIPTWHTSSRFQSMRYQTLARDIQSCNAGTRFKKEAMDEAIVQYLDSRMSVALGGRITPQRKAKEPKDFKKRMEKQSFEYWKQNEK